LTNDDSGKSLNFEKGPEWMTYLFVTRAEGIEAFNAKETGKRTRNRQEAMTSGGYQRSASKIWPSDRESGQRNV
jgi:hypothetical protein